ncbi:aldehyde dehydrogenase family protein [Parafrigoribacterium mesophilum]|uniref:aldehyde dehydrogenase family protein n=1 Tax=Parafrigoribacterium mesophilum TaxID=433646 RepID=UPI0031FDA911
MSTVDERQDFASYELFIDGSWEPSSDGRRIERTSPSDGRLIGSYARATLQDVDRAVAAARRAFDDRAWATLAAPKRAGLLRKISELLIERADDIGRRISLELGKPIALARNEVVLTAEVFEYYAALTLDQRSDLVSRHTPSALGLVLKEPVGVVAMITPWNFPLLLLSWKVAPALAAGCTMVAKPASSTPGSALDLAAVIRDAGVPDGVYNVLTGSGAEIGIALVEHEGVDKVAFTGSTEVGRTVMTSAAGTMKKISLELGGKSPNIIFADANLKLAVRNAYWGIFLNTGQACQAGSRVLVQREIHDEFVAALVEMTKKSRVGDPLDEQTMIGPLVDQGQLNTVMGYIDQGLESGAVLVAGGKRLAGDLEKGLFVEPTIFDDVDRGASIFQEEIFGPVLSITTFDTIDDAVRLANDSSFGLAASIWSSNIDTAINTAKRIQSGTVWINAYHDAGLPFVMPMGGYKGSGIGRELGREGLDQYYETKAVHIRLGKD